MIKEWSDEAWEEFLEQIKKDKNLQNQIKEVIAKASIDVSIENLTGNKEFNTLLEE